MNHICIERCSIDLVEPVKEQPFSSKDLKPVAKKSEELLYLSDREAVCLEACTRLYVRQTHSMLENFKGTLTF